MEEKVLKKLIASIKCSSCGQRYEVYNIDILGHNEGLWFLRTHCASCHTHCLVAAIIEKYEMPEDITDFTEAELEKFVTVDVVGADDVLNMHSFLKDFDGDFSCLFGQG